MKINTTTHFDIKREEGKKETLYFDIDDRVLKQHKTIKELTHSTDSILNDELPMY